MNLSCLFLPTRLAMHPLLLKCLEASVDTLQRSDCAGDMLRCFDASKLVYCARPSRLQPFDLLRDARHLLDGLLY